MPEGRELMMMMMMIKLMPRVSMNVQTWHNLFVKLIHKIQIDLTMT